MSEYMEPKRSRQGSYMKKTYGATDKFEPAPSPEQLQNIVEPTKYQYLYQMPIEELKQRVVGYFTSITDQIVNEHTGEVLYKYKITPTLGSFALALGVDPYTVKRYAEGEYEASAGAVKYGVKASKHCQILKNSLNTIRDFYERRLNTAFNSGGIIFWLKNQAGWRDEQTITVKPENPLGQVQSPDELERLVLPPAEDEE